MLKKKVRFVQIVADTGYIIGLDEEGEIWYRDKLPVVYTNTYNNSNTVETPKEKEKREKGELWKPMSMICELAVPEGIGPTQDIPPAPDAADVEMAGDYYGAD